MSAMGREFGGLDSFLSRAPQDDLVDVLILPYVDEDVEVGLADGPGRGRVAVLEDHKALLHQCGEIEKKLKWAGPRRVAAEALASIFNVQYAPEGVPGNFRLGVFDWMGSSEAQLAPVYVIRRNRIQGETLCRFLRSFRSIPSLRRPKIVVDAEQSVQEARMLLRKSRDSVRAFVPGRSGIQESGLDAAESSVDRFPEAILAGAFASCAQTQLAPPGLEASVAERRRYAAFLYQRVQANKGCDRRFDAAKDVELLENFARQELASEPGEADRRWFAEALVFALLDRSYVLEEGSEPVENALSISQQLDDADLEAWVLRHINISAGVSAFASEGLERAASLLQQAGRFTQAAYAATNRTLTDLHGTSGSIDLGRANDVVDYVLDWAPYCERLSSIINAAGVAALVAGNLHRAEELFRRAMDANGGSLHRISAQVNLAITKRVSGARLTVEDVEGIYRAIRVSNMSPRLNYHHVYLFANLIALTGSKRLKATIRRHLSEAAYLDYDEQTVAEDKLLPFLATKFTMIADGRRFRGRRGQFVEDYGMLPLAQFIWN